MKACLVKVKKLKQYSIVEWEPVGRLVLNSVLNWFNFKIRVYFFENDIRVGNLNRMSLTNPVVENSL